MRRILASQARSSCWFLVVFLLVLLVVVVLVVGVSQSEDGLGISILSRMLLMTRKEGRDGPADPADFPRWLAGWLALGCLPRPAAASLRAKASPSCSRLRAAVEVEVAGT